MTNNPSKLQKNDKGKQKKQGNQNTRPQKEVGMEIEKKFDDKQINEKKRKSISTRIPSQSQHKLPRTSPSQQKGKQEKQGNQNTHPQKEVVNSQEIGNQEKIGNERILPQKEVGVVTEKKTNDTQLIHKKTNSTCTSRRIVRRTSPRKQNFDQNIITRSIRRSPRNQKLDNSQKENHLERVTTSEKHTSCTTSALLKK